MKNRVSQLAVLLLTLLALAPATASARYLQCVGFARAASGIEIHGNAKTWWAQAAGQYERSSTPREGSVLTLPGSGEMRNGHVAMVSKIVAPREILLTHANWSYRGGIERNVRAVDVSDAGDWSRVKIWFAPNGDFGTTTYPAYGFIHQNAATPPDPFHLSEEVVEMARVESGAMGGSAIATLR